MQKKYRLKKKQDFRQVFRCGQSKANRQFVVYYRQRTEPSHFRLGISVSRKVGNAVIRNRVRRLVKEIVRGWADDLRMDRDLVVIARRPAATLDYQQMSRSLRHALKRANCFRRLPPV